MATDVINVKGIGPSAANVLIDQGIGTAEALAAAAVALVAAIPGFGEARARQVIEAAAELADAGPAMSEAEPTADAAEEQKEKKDKKNKKKEKKKGKKKGKKKKGKKGKQ